VGGSHYKTGGEEHWDRVYRLYGPGYFIGCITKYVERYQYKNGYEDLLKAQHFLEKLIELEGMKPKEEKCEDPPPPGHWIPGVSGVTDLMRGSNGISLRDLPDEAKQRIYDYARNADPADQEQTDREIDKFVAKYAKGLVK